MSGRQVMRPTPVTDADTPATAWFWALSNDHQVVVALLIASAVGLVIWLTRAVDEWAERKHRQVNANARVREYETRADHWAGRGPGR